MSKMPDTRQSLIGRVQNPDDREAWAEFVALYRPAVVRFALRRRLQPADAEDVAQRVFISVARAMTNWKADRAAGSFRAWLLQVTRHAVVNVLSRQPKARAAGGTSNLQRLDAHPEQQSMTSELEWEYRRAEFRKAAQTVQQEFEPTTWRAFWLTAVEQRPIAEVANQLGKSVGSIYAARSRIMRRIKCMIDRNEISTGGN